MPSLHGLSTLYNSMRFANQYRNQQQQQQNKNEPAFGSLDPYMKLAQQANQFMTGQAQAPFIANTPNYLASTAQEGGNVLSQLQGQLPQNVINEILTQAAQRGIGRMPGSPANNADYLRQIGLGSIDMMKLGREGLTQQITNTPVPEIWNPMSLFVPEYLAKLELEAARRGGAGAGGRVSFGGGGGGSFGTNPFNQTTLGFVAENQRKQAEQDAARQKANADYWAKFGIKKVPKTATTGTGTLTAQNPFGGFPSFSMSGLY